MFQVRDGRLRGGHWANLMLHDLNRVRDMKGYKTIIGAKGLNCHPSSARATNNDAPGTGLCHILITHCESYREQSKLYKERKDLGEM